jgi:hypothetical protein
MISKTSKTQAQEGAKIDRMDRISGIYKGQRADGSKNSTSL